MYALSIFEFTVIIGPTYFACSLCRHKPPTVACEVVVRIPAGAPGICDAHHSRWGVILQQVRCPRLHSGAHFVQCLRTTMCQTCRLHLCCKYDLYTRPPAFPDPLPWCWLTGHQPCSAAGSEGLVQRQRGLALVCGAVTSVAGITQSGPCSQGEQCLFSRGAGEA